MADETDKNIEMWKIKRVSYCSRPVAGTRVASLGPGGGKSMLLPASPFGPQLIKALEAARGNGTSMISLIMPPKDQVGTAAKRAQGQMRDR